MARAALYQLEGQCWQIIVVVAAGVAALALAVFYGLQQEAEKPKYRELRAPPCLRQDYGMLWDAQELKMDGGTFDAYTGLYNVPSEPKTWDQQCPSLVTEDPLLEPDEYENALVKRVKDVCNVQSCEISFLSQFWQQRCRDIDYGTAQRNCEATCIMDGDCLDHPIGGPPGPWVCRAGQAAPACVSRCEQTVQRLNDECFFMRDESSPYFHPSMVRQTLNYLSGDTCAEETCTDEELDINMGPLNARHHNRCSYSTFGDLVLNNCERKGCLDASADNSAPAGFVLGAEGEEVECITASCPTTLPLDIVEERNLQRAECNAIDRRVAADMNTCAAAPLDQSSCESVMTPATCLGVDNSAQPCAFAVPAQCTGTHDGNPVCSGYDDGTGSPATCTGNDDGTGTACALNADSTACAVSAGDCVFVASTLVSCTLNPASTGCAVDGGDCVFSAGSACALNSESTACATVNGVAGDCTFVPPPSALEADCPAECTYQAERQLCEFLPPIQCSDTSLGDSCTATCKPGFVPTWQYGMGGTAAELTISSGTTHSASYSNAATYGPTCTGIPDACAAVRGAALETPDACSAIDGCSYTDANVDALPAALPLRCGLDSTWDARGALMCVARPCDENIESNSDQRMPNQSPTAVATAPGTSTWCVGEVGDVCNFECALGYSRIGGPTCSGSLSPLLPAGTHCGLQAPLYDENACRPRNSAGDPIAGMGPDDCEYTPSQHVCSENPEGGASFQGGSCEPTPCTRGLTIEGADFGGAQLPCSGSTGDVCTFTCQDDYLRMGEHVCMPDGAFRGGECTQIPCTAESGIDVAACSLLPPDEDGDGSPDRQCTAAASSARSGKLAKYAFDGISSEEEIEYQHSLDGRYYYWHSALAQVDDTNPVTLQYNFDSQQPVCSYAITGPASNDDLGPRSFTFQGGNFNSYSCTEEGERLSFGLICQIEWVTLDSRTDVAWVEFQRRVFSVPEENWASASGGAYKYYRLRITDVALPNYGVEIVEFEIFPVATMQAVFPGDWGGGAYVGDMRDAFADSLGSMLGVDSSRIVVHLQGGSIIATFYIKAPAANAPADEPSTVQAYKRLQTQFADPVAVQESFGGSTILGGVPIAVETGSLVANPCNNIPGLNMSNGVHNCSASSMASGSSCSLVCDAGTRPSGDGVMTCFMGAFELETCVAEECDMLPGGSQFQIPGATHDCKDLFDNRLRHEDVCQITCDPSPQGTPMLPSAGGNISCYSGVLSGEDQVCVDPSCFVVAAMNGTNVSRLDFNNGVHDCPDIMLTGSSCNLTCSIGYAPPGAGAIECEWTELTLDSDQVSVDACQPVDCVTDSSLTTTDSGTRGCECNVGFSGTISWDAVTSSWAGVCEAVACVENSVPVDAGCLCNQGYSGVIEWAQSGQTWRGSCLADPCTSNSTKVTYTFWDSELEPPSSVQVTIGLGADRQVDSGAQTQPGDATCESWDASYRGDITLSCSLGQLALVGTGNCSHHNECAADEDDCVTAETLEHVAGAVCEHTGPATHECLCPLGYYGNGVDEERSGDPTDTSCRPCPDNSGESITGNRATRAIDLTGCRCNSGYTVDQGDDNSEPTQAIAEPDDTCVPVLCPENSEGDNMGQPCVCSEGYGGEIVWNAELNRYDGSCDATYCDVALESNPDDADTFYALQNGTHDCGDRILLGSNCSLTCDSGFAPEGDGVRSCLEGRLLEQEECVPLSCNLTGFVIENAAHSCATIEHGTTCVASCATEYLASGSDPASSEAFISCELGNVTSDSCELIECPVDGTERLVNADGTPGPCTCIPGYIGNVTYMEDTFTYEHNCIPGPCNADTPPVLYTHDDVTVTEASCTAADGDADTNDVCTSTFAQSQVCGAGCTLRQAGQRTAPIGLTSLVPEGEQEMRDCADWNENFRGIITLGCRFDEVDSTSGLVVIGDGCIPHNPCNASVGDGDDCHPDATCEDTVGTLGPGSHDCYCNPGFYGDGFTGTNHTGAVGVPAGCVACPDFSMSATTPQTSRPERRSDCICNPGYTTGGGSTEISDDSQECRPVECPEFSEGPGAGDICQCIDGYSGDITWAAPTTGTQSGAYEGSCLPDCPDGYTFSHYGVVEVSSDTFFPTESDAMSQDQYQTIAECKAMCEGEGGYGCVAYSFVAATNSSQSICRRYSTNGTTTEQDGATTCIKTLNSCPIVAANWELANGVTEGEAPEVQPRAASDATCTGNSTQTCAFDSVTNACPADCILEPAVEAIEASPAIPACGGAVQSGETCALTCDVGYSATLAADAHPTAEVGQMFCYHGDLAEQTCEPNPCDISSLFVQDGTTDCTGNQVQHGATCGLVCNAGYTSSGDRSLLCTLGNLEIETCDVVPCPASATGGSGEPCVCDPGYSGEIDWDPDTGTYEGECTPNPCDSSSFIYNGSTINTTITIQSSSTDAVDCNTWQAGYQGSIALACNLGELTVTNATCEPVDRCVRQDDDCHSDVSQCIYTGPGTHVCNCNTGYWGDGHGTEGCLECPQYSTTLDSTAVVTDCRCNLGYYNPQTNDQQIETSSTQCQPVPCPENSAAANSAENIVAAEQVCECIDGFEGQVTWNDLINDYSSTCTPICPVGSAAAAAACVPSESADAGTTCSMDGEDQNTCGNDGEFVEGACVYVPAVQFSPEYTWSHAGWFNTHLSDANLFGGQNAQPAAAASVAECAGQCNYGCAAFSFVVDQAPNATSVCYLYSATDANDQTVASASSSCLKTVAPCSGTSVSIDQRTALEACDDVIQSGITCDLTCTAGYQPALPADSSDFAQAGQMYCFDGSLAVQTCRQVTCDTTDVVSSTSSCTGTADVVQAAVPATCTGSATDGVTVCDLDASTDNTAECADGCTSTEAVAEERPTCDLDPDTDETAECATGCVFVLTEHNCPDDLPVGSTCELTCPAGYATTVSDREISCAELTPFGSQLIAPTCTAVDCPDNSNAAEDRATCNCFTGYQGTIEWDPATQAYTGTCTPMPCDESTAGVTFTFDNEASEINLAMNVGDARTIDHEGSGSIQCQDWNPNYRGSIGLECSAGTLTVVDGAECSAWDRCSEPIDNDCVAPPLAVCQYTGPGTHACICDTSTTFGDGYLNGTGCVECPASSAVPDPRPNRSTIVTDCVCAVGYTGDIVNTTSTCTAVPCPEYSSGDGAGAACTCNSGYEGDITWVQEDNAYAGSCVSICPAGYSYSHAGVLGGATMAETATQADQTMESCATVCNSLWGCVAYSFEDSCTIDNVASERCCSMFDTADGSQEGPNDGSAQSCIRVVQRCTADLNFAFGSNDCGDNLESGTSCSLTCDAGYTHSGDASIDCFDGQLRGDDQVCTESPCDPPQTIENSDTVCTSLVESGSVCTVTCSAGYSVPATAASCTTSSDDALDCSTGYVSGNATTCPSGCRFTASANRSRTGAMECLRGDLPLIQCTADPCSIEDDMVENAQTHDCGTQINSGDTCDITCAPGFHAGRVEPQTDATITCNAGEATTTAVTGSCSAVSCVPGPV